jgi:hypothetical protein
VKAQLIIEIAFGCGAADESAKTRPQAFEN